MSLSSQTDVFVIGGGPAGLAAALAATRRGMTVTVADAGRPPLDKACGEGLMPDSQSALLRVGVPIDVSIGHTFRGIRFVDGGASAAADFPEGDGVGVRRVRLHEVLIAACERAGVRMLWEARVTGFEDGLTAARVSMDGHALRTQWIVGADGQNSQVRRWAGLESVRGESFRYGFRRHYRIAPWSRYMELHWGPRCQIYVTPVAHDEVCVALISRDPKLRLDQALPLFPAIARRLERAEQSSPERGAVSASRSLRDVYRGRVVLVGDASGSVDAITGEGLCLSFRQSLALARALESGDLAPYAAEHRRLGRRPSAMANLMLTLDRFPQLRRKVLRAFSAQPALFANQLAMHVGAISSTDFLFRGMLPLGWQILTV